MQHRFAHGLAGNGACVDTGAAQHGATFDKRHTFFGLRTLYRGALAGGSGADDDQIEGLHLGGGRTYLKVH